MRCGWKSQVYVKGKCHSARCGRKAHAGANCGHEYDELESGKAAPCHVNLNGVLSTSAVNHFMVLPISDLEKRQLSFHGAAFDYLSDIFGASSYLYGLNCSFQR